ncbi:NADP-dependent oxidoreductase domain-containing protein [Aspergillus pseudonomiae]|nr:NADP-dependent oxidoreductase domain-containing protein [Aspergillus pseudonomiae]
MARSAMPKVSWDRHLLRSVQSAPPATLPVFIYGTAWKKDRTTDLVYQALNAGFRAVDTAAQPKHYREDLIQTKFTSIHGQNPDEMPYDPNSSVTEQVHASIKSSLEHLRASDAPESVNEAYIDMLVLHSPLPTMSQTLEAWSTFETYVPHRIRNLGISNCTLPQLRELSALVKVKPAVVQNRFYGGTQFDVPLRSYCRDNDIIYQSFWTLTANPELVQSDAIQLLASRTEISPAAALYCLVLALGNTTLLNGTSNRGRMEADLAAPARVERFSQEHPEVWQRVLENFQQLTGDRVAL